MLHTSGPFKWWLGVAKGGRGYARVVGGGISYACESPCYPQYMFNNKHLPTGPRRKSEIKTCPPGTESKSFAQTDTNPENTFRKQDSDSSSMSQECGEEEQSYKSCTEQDHHQPLYIIQYDPAGIVDWCEHGSDKLQIIIDRYCR